MSTLRFKEKHEVSSTSDLGRPHLMENRRIRFSPKSRKTNETMSDVEPFKAEGVVMYLLSPLEREMYLELKNRLVSSLGYFKGLKSKFELWEVAELSPELHDFVQNSRFYPHSSQEGNYFDELTKDTIRKADNYIRYHDPAWFSYFSSRVAFFDSLWERAEKFLHHKNKKLTEDQTPEPSFKERLVGEFSERARLMLDDFEYYYDRAPEQIRATSYFKEIEAYGSPRKHFDQILEKFSKEKKSNEHLKLETLFSFLKTLEDFLNIVRESTPQEASFDAEDLEGLRVKIYGGEKNYRVLKKQYGGLNVETRKFFYEGGKKIMKNSFFGTKLKKSRYFGPLVERTFHAIRGTFRQGEIRVDQSFREKMRFFIDQELLSVNDEKMLESFTESDLVILLAVLCVRENEAWYRLREAEKHSIENSIDEEIRNWKEAEKTVLSVYKKNFGEVVDITPFISLGDFGTEEKTYDHGEFTEGRRLQFTPLHEVSEKSMPAKQVASMRIGDDDVPAMQLEPYKAIHPDHLLRVNGKEHALRPMDFNALVLAAEKPMGSTNDKNGSHIGSRERVSSLDQLYQKILFERASIVRMLDGLKDEGSGKTKSNLVNAYARYDALLNDYGLLYVKEGLKEDDFASKSSIEKEYLEFVTCVELFVHEKLKLVDLEMSCLGSIASKRIEIMADFLEFPEKERQRMLISSSRDFTTSNEEREIVQRFIQLLPGYELDEVSDLVFQKALLALLDRLFNLGVVELYLSKAQISQFGSDESSQHRSLSLFYRSYGEVFKSYCNDYLKEFWESVVRFVKRSRNT